VLAVKCAFLASADIFVNRLSIPNEAFSFTAFNGSAKPITSFEESGVVECSYVNCHLEKLDRKLIRKYIQVNDTVLQMNGRFGRVACEIANVLTNSHNQVVVTDENFKFELMLQQNIHNCNFWTLEGAIGKRRDSDTASSTAQRSQDSSSGAVPTITSDIDSSIAADTASTTTTALIVNTSTTTTFEGATASANNNADNDADVEAYTDITTNTTRLNPDTDADDDGTATTDTTITMPFNTDSLSDTTTATTSATPETNNDVTSKNNSKNNADTDVDDDGGGDSSGTDLNEEDNYYYSTFTRRYFELYEVETITNLTFSAMYINCGDCIQRLFEPATLPQVLKNIHTIILVGNNAIDLPDLPSKCQENCVDYSVLEVKLHNMGYETAFKQVDGGVVGSAVMYYVLQKK
jgi:hypothetical protein